MEKYSEDNNQVKIGFKIGLRTLAMCFIALMFVYCSIFVLFPQTSFKINQKLGLHKVQELNLEKIYKKSGNAGDLYNLIISTQKNGHYKKELKYINEMLDRDDYEDFCDRLDEASLKSIKDKNLVPYSSNVNGYFLSRKVICIYSLKLDNLETYIYDGLSNGKVTEYGFSTYVDLIYSDEDLTKEEKIEKYNDLMQTSKVSGETLVTLSSLLDERISNINAMLSSVENNDKQIILTYCLMRIYQSKFYIYETTGNETNKARNYELYIQAKTSLNQLVNK